MGEVLGLPGVREYPRGRRGRGDVDSGPIILGFSGPSVVVGMAAARAHGDAVSAQRILCLIEVVGLPIEFQGRRFYAAGALPIGDAFLAWARSTPPPVSTGGAGGPWEPVLTGRWALLLHLLSASVLVLVGLPLWRPSDRPSGGKSIAC
jgi:hypothetical protein